MTDSRTLMDNVRELDNAFSDIACDYAIPTLVIILGVVLLILQTLFPLRQVSNDD